MAASRIAGVLFVVALVSPFARAQAPGDAAGERARREAVARGLDSLARAWTPDAADKDRQAGVAVASEQ